MRKKERGVTWTLSVSYPSLPVHNRMMALAKELRRQGQNVSVSELYLAAARLLLAKYEPKREGGE